MAAELLIAAETDAVRSADAFEQGNLKAHSPLGTATNSGMERVETKAVFQSHGETQSTGQMQALPSTPGQRSPRSSPVAHGDRWTPLPSSSMEMPHPLDERRMSKWRELVWEKEEAEVQTLAAFYDQYVRKRLEVGTRYLTFRLLEDTRGEPFHGSFVGSITMLKEHYDRSPNKLFVQYNLVPYLAVGMSHDRFGAEAWDYGGTDGTAVLKGLLFYLAGRYPNPTPLTPYVEIGIADYSAHFENSPEWGQAGNKKFLLDDPRGKYLGAGCGIELYKGLSLDIYGRRMSVDVTGGYYLNENRQEDIIFTVSHVAYGMGLKYVF